MNALIITAHQDDEILGAGATIRKMLRKGWNVATYSLSDKSPTREDNLKERQAESCKIIGEVKIYTGSLAAMEFPMCDRYKEVGEIETIMGKEKPDLIITHFPNDLHNDHKITAGLVMEAARLPLRRTGYNGPIPKVMFMEVLTSTEWATEKQFHPNYYEEVCEEDLKKKEQALEVYKGVIRGVPHPRNAETIEALARYRGAQAGVKYAEAFETMMEVKRL